MGSAKLLSALLGLGVIVVAGAQSATPEQCPPCNKMLQPVCGVDEDDETKTFPNECMMRWCNCMLRNADSDRSFKELNRGFCDGDASNETEIPECFPEMETTSEAEDDGSTSRTLHVMEVTPATAAGNVPRTQNASVVTPTVGTRVVPRTQSVSEATPTAGAGLVPRTHNASEATPAAGAGLAPGPFVVVATLFAMLVAAAGDL